MNWIYLPLSGLLQASDWGVYDDTRSMVALREHYPRVEEVPIALLSDFLTEVQKVAQVLQSVTRCEQVTISLSSAPHVHALLTPVPSDNPINVEEQQQPSSTAPVKELHEQLQLAAVPVFHSPRRQECTITRTVTYKCKHCLWILSGPVADEELGFTEWQHHYSEKCSCQSPGCSNPQTAGSLLCDYHDVHGEEEL